MKKLFTLLLCAVFAVLMSQSCKKDWIDPNDIYGQWEMVSYTSSYGITSVSETVFLSFRSDGYCDSSYESPEVVDVEKNFKISGNRLYVKDLNGSWDDMDYVIIIKTLTATRMVLRFEFDSESWSEAVFDKITGDYRNNTPVAAGTMAVPEKVGNRK